MNTTETPAEARLRAAKPALQAAIRDAQEAARVRLDAEHTRATARDAAEALGLHVRSGDSKAHIIAALIVHDDEVGGDAARELAALTEHADAQRHVMEVLTTARARYDDDVATLAKATAPDGETFRVNPDAVAGLAITLAGSDHAANVANAILARVDARDEEPDDAAVAVARHRRRPAPAKRPRRDHRRRP